MKNLLPGRSIQSFPALCDRVLVTLTSAQRNRQSGYAYLFGTIADQSAQDGPTPYLIEHYSYQCLRVARLHEFDRFLCLPNISRGRRSNHQDDIRVSDGGCGGCMLQAGWRVVDEN